jgi:hypothetical protein
LCAAYSQIRSPLCLKILIMKQCRGLVVCVKSQKHPEIYPCFMFRLQLCASDVTFFVQKYFPYEKKRIADDMVEKIRDGDASS